MHFTRSYFLFFLSFLTPCLAMQVKPRSIYGDMRNLDINDLDTYVKNIHTNEKVSLPKGFNLLHLAAMLRATEQAHIIIESKKYDINQHDNEKGFTPLMIACNENNAAITYLLLSGGANPGIVSKKGVMPLIKAIHKENSFLVNLLLENGANVNQKDVVSDNTPLHAAIDLGNSDIVTLLLAHKASPDLDLKHCFTPLMAAAQMNINTKNQKTHCLRIVQALLDAKANHCAAYLKDQDTALHLAVATHNRDVVYLLLKAGADANALNTDKDSPFACALYNIRDADEENYTKLKRDCSIARLLLLHGAKLSKEQIKNKNINLNALLTTAIFTNTNELIKFCLEAGANVNYRNGLSDTPLHLVARRMNMRSQSVTTALLLLEKGADIKLVDAKKCNVLDILLHDHLSNIHKK